MRYIPRRTYSKEERHAYDVLMQAEYAWTALDRFRKERKRNMRYTYGDQWGDYVRDERGRMVQERELIKRNNGAEPITNNMIRKLVSTVKGLYLSSNSEANAMARDKAENSYATSLSELLKYVRDINDGLQMYSDLFEEFVISGFAGCRKTYAYMGDRLDCWTTRVQADNFFVDPGMADVRGWDCAIIGEIHDLTWGDLLTTFAKKPSDIERLKGIYHFCGDEHYLTQTAEQFGYKRDLNASFLLPQDTSACRVIEVWNKERKGRYHCIDWLNGEMFKIEESDKRELVDNVNEQRRAEMAQMGVDNEEIDSKMISAEWFVDNYWYFRMYAPTGEVLMEGETPYAHGEHPFVFRFYPFVNSEIHSFVGDVIDTQRYINKLINLNEYLLRTSAKGLLAVPDSALEGTGLDIGDIADVWAKPGGVFVFKAKAGVPLPTQITNSTHNLGISELLQIEKQFFDDITGVNGALQGKSQGSISGLYYQQQAANSSMSLQGLLSAYSGFVKASANKDCKLIQQFYDEHRILSILGREGNKFDFDADRIKNLDFDITISESQSTPLYRQAANEFLMSIWQSGQISLNTMLEAGEFPFGDKLQALAKAEQDEQAQQQAAMQQAAQMAQQGALPQGEGGEQMPPPGEGGA